MNLGELRDSAYRILQDEEGDRWSAEEITAYLDQAHRDFLRRTGGLSDSATLSNDSSRTPTYAFWLLPTNVLKLDRIKVGSTVLRRRQLREMHDTWESDSGSAVDYLLGPFGYRTIRITPYPTVTQTVTAYYLKSPASLSSTNTPEIPEAFHDALIHGAVARAYLKDFEAKDPAKASVYQQLYETALAEAVGYASEGHDNADRRIILPEL